jgi:hypothetical protein
VSSTRYAKYVEEHHTINAWELDAIPPQRLDLLIQQAVRGHFDPVIAGFWRDVVMDERDRLQSRMVEPGWIADNVNFPVWS